MIQASPHYVIVPLVVGYILDLIIGDPHWLPHPIRLFGKVISFFENNFNNGKNRKIKGAVVALSLVLTIWLGFFLLLMIMKQTPQLYIPIATIFVFYGLANHNLISESQLVNKKLKNEGLVAGQKQLRFIVGRDTTVLSENQIRIALLETLSENLNDGVIAPMFFYALGGVPLMMVYKMINTLDSMIGYKNCRFKDFGMFAARMDDVANFIPARITALLMVLVSFSLRGLKFIFIYGDRHPSPNSGFPEAALAGILNCRLGGPATYKGQLFKKHFIGYNDRKITDFCIHKACMINLVVSAVWLTIILFVF